MWRAKMLVLAGFLGGGYTGEKLKGVCMRKIMSRVFSGVLGVMIGVIMMIGVWSGGVVATSGGGEFGGVDTAGGRVSVVRILMKERKIVLKYLKGEGVTSVPKRLVIWKWKKWQNVGKEGSVIMDEVDELANFEGEKAIYKSDLTAEAWYEKLLAGEEVVVEVEDDFWKSSAKARLNFVMETEREGKRWIKKWGEELVDCVNDLNNNLVEICEREVVKTKWGNMIHFVPYRMIQGRKVRVLKNDAEKWGEDGRRVEAGFLDSGELERTGGETIVRYVENGSKNTRVGKWRMFWTEDGDAAVLSGKAVRRGVMEIDETNVFPIPVPIKTRQFFAGASEELRKNYTGVVYIELEMFDEGIFMGRKILVKANYMDCWVGKFQGGTGECVLKKREGRRSYVWSMEGEVVAGENLRMTEAEKWEKTEEEKLEEEQRRKEMVAQRKQEEEMTELKKEKEELEKRMANLETELENIEASSTSEKTKLVNEVASLTKRVKRLEAEKSNRIKKVQMLTMQKQDLEKKLREINEMKLRIGGDGAKIADGGLMKVGLVSEAGRGGWFGNVERIGGEEGSGVDAEVRGENGRELEERRGEESEGRGEDEERIPVPITGGGWEEEWIWKWLIGVSVLVFGVVVGGAGGYAVAKRRMATEIEMGEVSDGGEIGVKD